MLTTSGGGGAAVVTVSVPCALPSPPQQATPVTATGVVALTRLVVTGKSTEDLFADTTTWAGTWTTAGLPLVRFTSAPPAGAPFSGAPPVAGPGPPRLRGEETMETREGPGG